MLLFHLNSAYQDIQYGDAISKEDISSLWIAMKHLAVASVQFENTNGNTTDNLEKIRILTARAASLGPKVVAFHECRVSGYTFARRLSREGLLDVSEHIPSGPSCQTLIDIARAHEVAVLAGLFERGEGGNIFNTYVCVTGSGLVAKTRKIHPFINPHLSPGKEYVVFDLYGWKCGILICYDNNVIENVRATALLGAEIIFMPHVTMCPTSLRAEFDGLKSRQWLMKWLPARAYDNAVYVIFSNPIGMEDDQLKNGCSMIIDLFGDVLCECRELSDNVVVGCLTKEKLTLAGGSRYRAARRPQLYGEILVRGHEAKQQVSWISNKE